MPYYYRGTTRGWPGNSSLSENRVTFVSTDPLVATLFAIECRRRGKAAVLVASPRNFEVVTYDRTGDLIDQALDGAFNDRESAIQLAVSPAEFEAQADFIVEVDLAIEVLKELGFDGIPILLGSRDDLNDELTETLRRGARLSLKEIREFDDKIKERLR